MSSPTSVKMTPPNYIDPRIRRRYLWMYIIQVWVSLLPTAFGIYWIFSPWFDYVLPVTIPIMPFSLPELVGGIWDYPTWFAIATIPILLIFLYILTVASTAIVTKFSIGFLSRLHKPKEGIFFRDPKDKDFLYWNLRNLSRVFLFWVLHSSPSTLLKKFFGYSMFGIPIDRSTVINNTWISPEFVQIGKNVIIGQSASLYSYQIQGNKLLVAQIVIEDNVRIGPQVVLLPGIHVKHDAIISGGSFAHPFTVFEENASYQGGPAQKIDQ
ncbi:MAG: acyltransferase [Promethearchaeota archaeon]